MSPSARDDPIVNVREAEYLADHISDAQLLLIEGDFHVSWIGSDNDESFAAIRSFLLGQTDNNFPISDRVLSTVLFTDIVTSTDRAVEVGDARWRTLLDRHDELCRREVSRYRGVHVKSTGDGILAHFDGPGRAVNCAQRLNQHLTGLGLRIRAGAHSGEIELRDNDIGGIAVHIAARVMSYAAPGEVLVTRTVKDLTVGTGLTFDDRGEQALKGIPERWQLYAVVS